MKRENNKSMRNQDFIDWIERGMSERDWRPADLSRASGLSQAALSHILNGDRGAGSTACVAIARAFGAPPEDALMLAGHLPRVSKTLNDRQDTIDLIAYLDEDNYSLVHEFVKWRFEQQRKHEKGNDNN